MEKPNSVPNSICLTILSVKFEEKKEGKIFQPRRNTPGCIRYQPVWNGFCDGRESAGGCDSKTGRL